MKLLKNNWLRFILWYLCLLLIYESFWAADTAIARMMMLFVAAACMVAGIKVSGRNMWPFKEQ